MPARPGDEPFERALAELEARVRAGFAALGLDPPALEQVEPEDAVRRLEGEPGVGSGDARRRSPDEYVVEAFGEALLELAERNERLVVLDADLASDCRVRAFELAYPERFVECGIAEQDMVSTAAGLARHGYLPVVNSFAAFLASRANEQIYNQASEGSKVVYALHYAGLIPAGPGKSHQSLRDVSLLAALPGMTLVQPGERGGDRGAPPLGGRGRGRRTSRFGSRSGRRRGESSCRAGYEPAVGRGAVLREGRDGVLLAYGPVMLHEALLASEHLAARGSRPARRGHALAQPFRPRTGWRPRSRPTSTSSSSRTTLPSARSATRSAGRSRAA